MSGAVWRQIIGISAFNIAVMAAVICLGNVLYQDAKGEFQNTVDPCDEKLPPEGPGCPLTDSVDGKYSKAQLAIEKHK